ncbi:hypothetical protein ACLM5H_18675 [Fredinandcohnia humi]
MNEVNQFLRELTAKAKTTLNQTSHAVKAKLDSVLHKPSLTIDELAQFIARHPNTIFDTKVFLGFQYHFYHLTIEDTTFYLETKGDQGDYILELTVNNSCGTIFDYHSFEHKYNLDEKVRVPEVITNLVH